MKKLLVFIIILIVFFFGLRLGSNYIGKSNLFEEKKETFEEEIQNPNNDYESTTLKPQDNIINKIAHKIDELIQKISNKVN